MKTKDCANTPSFPATSATKDKTPPNDGFWSLALYNNEHLFEPNPLNRFSLCTKNKKLIYGEDGSWTLYAGARSPSVNKKANWLPAPDDELSLDIRAYWPKQAILHRSWEPPTIVRASEASVLSRVSPMCSFLLDRYP